MNKVILLLLAPLIAVGVVSAQSCIFEAPGGCLDIVEPEICEDSYEIGIEGIVPCFFSFESGCMPDYESSCEGGGSFSCFGVEPEDPRVCSGNGVCVDQDLCECNEGYTGSECETETCIPSTEIPDGSDNDCDGLIDETTAKVIDSEGNPISGARIQYKYLGSVKQFGYTDSNGVAELELPALQSYEFWATHLKKTAKKTDDISSDLYVEFQTSNVTVEVLDSTGAPISGVLIKHRTSGFQTWGDTGSNGRISNEIFDGSYKFDATYAKTNAQKTETVIHGSIVQFQTVNACVNVYDCNGPLAGATVLHQSLGSWTNWGVTDSTGRLCKELFAGEYTFWTWREKHIDELFGDFNLSESTEVTFLFDEPCTGPGGYPVPEFNVAGLVAIALAVIIFIILFRKKH